MKHIALVAGARPNFMKVAPLRAALAARGARITFIHTGQHYDPLMSDVFFRDLGLPAPDVHLGGSSTASRFASFATYARVSSGREPPARCSS